MACLEMYNNTHTSPSPSSQPHPQPSPPMSPRISFSNDFVESHHSHSFLRSEPSTAASSDFEFSVSNYNMMSADELFSKGRILPFSFKDRKKNPKTNTQMQRTLRDELLADDQDNNNDFSVKPPKASSSSSSSNGWKGFLGLRKSHIGSKKPPKTDFSFDSANSFSLSPPQDSNTKSSQSAMSNEGGSSNDMEMGV